MSPDHIATWWIAVGFVLIVSEFFAPMFVLVFLGVAALITGGALLVGLPQHSAIPYATFAATSVVLLILLRKAARRHFRGLEAEVVAANPGFNDIVGKEAVVISGFSEGNAQGRVSFRGTEWDAASDVPLLPGDRVTICSHESHKLRVKKS